MIRSILTIFDGLSKKETEEEHIEIFTFESIDDDKELASVNVGEPIEETKFENEPSTKESVHLIQGPEFASSLNSSAAEFIPKWVQDDDSSCESMSCSPISFMPLDFYSLNPGLVHGGHFPTSYSRKAFTVDGFKKDEPFSTFTNSNQIDQNESHENEILVQKWNVNAKEFVPIGHKKKIFDESPEIAYPIRNVQLKDEKNDEFITLTLIKDSDLPTYANITKKDSIDSNVTTSDANTSWQNVAKEDKTDSENKVTVEQESKKKKRGRQNRGKKNKKANLDEIKNAIESEIITGKDSIDSNVSASDANASFDCDKNKSNLKENDDTKLEILTPTEESEEWSIVCRKNNVAKEDNSDSENKITVEKESKKKKRGRQNRGNKNKKANLDEIKNPIESEIITPNEIPKIRNVEEGNDYESWQKMIEKKVNRKTLHCVILDEKPINTPHNVIQTHVTKCEDFSDATTISENRGEEFKMNNKQNTVFHDPKKFYKCKIVLAQDLVSLDADTFEIFVPKIPVKVVNCTLKKKSELFHTKELGFKYPIFVMDSEKHYFHFLHQSMKYDNVEFVSHEQAEKISWKAMKAKKDQVNANVQPKTLKRKFGRNTEFFAKVAKNVNGQKRPF